VRRSTPAVWHLAAGTVSKVGLAYVGEGGARDILALHFRIQVSHQTQKPPSGFFPLAGIRVVPNVTVRESGDEGLVFHTSR